MSQELVVKFVDSITEIGQQRWNALAGTVNPFMRYEFLWTLENTGCTTRRSGWQPHHAVVYERNTSSEISPPVAVMALYQKSNSYGEYVFDWSWAHAYQEYGLDYYPKFVSAAPFTPSEGKRLFVSPQADSTAVATAIMQAVKDRAGFINASSWHVLFPTEQEHEALASLGMLARSACQFHWHNRDYRSFNDFLSALSSRKRKNIRKERTRVAEDNIVFRRIEGADIDEALWQGFYTFYQGTYMMRGMQGYLNLRFFIELGKTMSDQLLMICAEKDKRTIAAALFFKNQKTLYGRYWGSARDHQFLHFETCFYQGQEYAIDHGLLRFDSGAQGEHKIQRGFEPTVTYSNHWIANKGFREAIEKFLLEEKPYIKRYIEEANLSLPFKQQATND